MSFDELDNRQYRQAIRHLPQKDHVTTKSPSKVASKVPISEPKQFAAGLNPARCWGAVWAIYQHLACGCVSFPNKYGHGNGRLRRWQHVIQYSLPYLLLLVWLLLSFNIPALVSFLRAYCSLIHLIAFFSISQCAHLIYHLSLTTILFWIAINSKRCHKKL